MILASGNLWNSAAINYTPMETVCHILIGFAHGSKFSHQVLQIQRNLTVRPVTALVDAVLGDIFARSGVHAEFGNNGKAHILQQPQLHRTRSQHRADIAVAHILIQKRCPLLEQLRAMIIRAEGVLAVCAVGIDCFSIVPNDLQQGALVDVPRKIVDLDFGIADLRASAEQRGQRVFQLRNFAHGNSSNRFSDSAFSDQGGYAPQWQRRVYGF